MGGLLGAFAATALAQPSLMENLGRGVVAVRSTPTDVFIGWRLLGTDPGETSFNLYRSTGGGEAVRLNATPLTGATHYVDSTADLTQPNAYFVRPIVFGLEQPASAPFTLAADAPVQQYLRIPLQVPPGGTTPVGESYVYSPNDASVGDLDGDGEYEIVLKWDPSNSKDNSQSGYTGNVYFDAYKLDGTRLWRIDLGRNIRAGAHYTQLMVYDLDGDGRAEVACRTADGTIDGLGNVIGDPSADWRNTAGYVLAGPEFLTVFDGRTGGALATTSYVPPRGNVGDWGDTYGNRVDRFLGAIAYLDGQRPSLVMARGYYTRTVLAAWNWRDGQLTNVWTFDTGHTGTPNPFAGYRGMGNHNLSVGDFDGDGRDEIMYGASAIDDDGTGLFTTGWGHGDALHVTDMDPDRPGLEAFQPHESPGLYGPNALELRDARTGTLIFGVQGTGDIGRGLALDVDPRYRGYELWGAGPTGGMYTVQRSTPNALLGPRGLQISATKPSINFGIWWDGDLLRELLDGTTISKWNWLAGNTTALLAPTGLASNNGTKATPVLSADILGDWREEVIWRESGNAALRIYTTTIPTEQRFYTLMHDRQYRLAIAWQNVGYNQPPHPGFFLGDGMAPPPIPNIVTSLRTLLGPPAPVFTGVTEDTGASSTDRITRDTGLVISGTAQSGTTVTVTRLGVGVIGTTLADTTGRWDLDYSAVPLPEGVARFTATATNQAGDTGPPSLPFAVTVDTTPPAAPAIASVSQEETLALPPDQGPPPGVSRLVFRGTAEAGSTVEVSVVGAGSLGFAVVDEAGRWQLDAPGPPLSPAAYAFTATASDRAGNQSDASAAFTVDTTVTTPSITGIADDTGVSSTDGITSDNTLLLSGTAGPDDVLSVSLSGSGVLGSTTADSSGRWTFETGVVLPDGAHSFSATGRRGMAVSPSSRAFVATVDTVAPVVVSVNRQNPPSASSSAASITFRVTFNESVGGVDAGDFTPAFTGGLSGMVSGVVPTADGVVDVTVGPLSGEGSVRLDVNGAGTGISDLAGHDLAAGFNGGQTYTRLLVGNGTWIRSASDGLWSANANWQDGIVGGASGSTASFDVVEIEGPTAVHLDSPREIGNLVFGDTDVLSAGSWILDDNGDPANRLTLSVPSGSPTITVSTLGVDSAAVLAAPVAGTAGFTKLGPGTLAFSRDNTLTGTLNVSGGTVRLDAGATMNLGAGAVNVTTTPGAQIVTNGGTFAARGLLTVGSGTGGGNAPGIFRLDAGSAVLGNVRTNSDSGSTVRVGGGSFTATDVNIRRNSAGTPDFASGFIVTGGVATVGTIGLGTANSNGALSITGGSLTATGPVTIGNQATAGRGGAMRVLGGAFTSTDAASGVVLARTSGTNANNVASATFTGGVSQIERLTLGFDATVTAGSATVTLNGGALYVGSGGIVRNGTGSFATTLGLGSGTLGARASWSTSLPITLPAGGNVTVKAADASDVPHDVTLLGPLTGPGGFTKAGDGTLALGAANTFAGPLSLSAGALRLDGTLAAGPAVAVNGGVLTGGGTLSRDVSLNANGSLEPGATSPGSVLTAGSLTWNGGGRLVVDLATGRHLVLTGTLTRGLPGRFEVALATSVPLSVGTSYTVATYASTDFTGSDFTPAGPTGYRGVFVAGPGALQFLVTGAGPTAEYTHWAYLNLPEGQRAATDDPDGDGLFNLLEFGLGLPPTRSGADGIRATTVEEDGVTYPAIAYRRRQDLGGVTIEARVSSSLDFAASLGWVEVSAEPRGDGTEDVLVRSAVPLAQQPRQFFRLAVSLAGETTVLSSPVGVLLGGVSQIETGLALPLIADDTFVGVVESNTATVLSFPAGAGDVGAALSGGGPYYVEVVTGALEGERLDVDLEATTAAAGPAVVLSLGPTSFSTLTSLPAGALAGARCVIRPHLTLAKLQPLFTPGLAGGDVFPLADGVRLFEGGAFVFYHLRADGATWSRPGSALDYRGKVIPPDASFLLEVKSRRQSWVQAGKVRMNAFRKNLAAGFQSFATGFPVDLSPAQIRAFVDAAAPAETRWTGNNAFLFADQIELLFRPGRLLDGFFLRADGVTWRSFTTQGSLASPVLGATDGILVRRQNADPRYIIPRPFAP